MNNVLSLSLPKVFVISVFTVKYDCVNFKVIVTAFIPPCSKSFHLLCT